MDTDRFLKLNTGYRYTDVDFKSHYNKTKRSEMDISNIYSKKTKVLKYLHKTE